MYSFTMHARVLRLRQMGVLLGGELPPEAQWAMGIFETSISDLGTGRSTKRLVLRDSRASPDRGLLFELYHPMLVEARDPYLRLRGIEETPLGQGERGAMVQEWLVRFIG